MQNKKLVFVVVLFLLGNLYAQNNDDYLKRQFVKGNDTLNYRILYPEKFSKTKAYPLVLFLHGSGERGKDNTKQLIHGSSLFLDSINRKKYPAIVIFPQCAREDYWANVIADRSTKPFLLKFPEEGEPTKSLSLVLSLLDVFINEPIVEKKQVYVGGLSMGGMGTFEILSRKPGLFAAAFAICGGGNLALTEKYATNTALWVFHGANDNVVNPQLSIDMVSSIINFSGKPNFTLYGHANHNSWDAAFAEPELLSWLFSNIKQ